MDRSFKFGHLRVLFLLVSGLLLFFLCRIARTGCAGESKGRPVPAKSDSGTALPTGTTAVPSGVSPEDAERVRELLLRWREAWERKDLETYLSCYSARFTFRSGGMTEFRAYKQGVFAKPGSVVVTLSNVAMKKEGEFIVVGFRQDYQTAGFRDSGPKELFLVWENGAWRIVREEWRKEK